MTVNKQDLQTIEEYQDIIRGIIRNIEQKLLNHAKKNEILDLVNDIVINSREYYIEVGKKQILANIGSANKEKEKYYKNRKVSETTKETKSLLDLKGLKKRVIECNNYTESTKLGNRLKAYASYNKLPVTVSQRKTTITIKEKI